MQNKNKLLALYHETSKHSNYQILASPLEKYIGGESINVTSRNEKERLKYFVDNVKLQGEKVLDVGGNTGYFSFELLNNGASYVSYYEGNKAHALFVSEAAKVLNVEGKIDIHNEYYLFDDTAKEKYDVIFLLNVLHHVGDDYGDEALSKEKALEIIAKSLQNLASKTDTLVFQLGFNWKGNRALTLFKNGTKADLIAFVRDAVNNFFEITSIGIAEKTLGCVVYNSLNDININRDDKLGEFLNRPIFIMRAVI